VEATAGVDAIGVVKAGAAGAVTPVDGSDEPGPDASCAVQAAVTRSSADRMASAEVARRLVTVGSRSGRVSARSARSFSGASGV